MNEPVEVKDPLNFKFVSRWLSTFGLRTPTSLEVQAALIAVNATYNLLGNGVPSAKVEARFAGSFLHGGMLFRGPSVMFSAMQGLESY